VAHDLATELPLCEVRREALPVGPPRPPEPVDRNLAAGVTEGIALAGGARIDGYLTVHGRAAIGIEGIASRGGAPQVEILVQVEGGAEKVLARLEQGSKAGAWEIPGDGERLVRWTFRASGDAAAWAIMRRPVVRSTDRLPSAPPKTVTAASPSAKHSNILLFLIDTLRTDRVGAYGATRGLTPRIDALGRQGIVFEQTTAASSWTRPSTATILTGLPPAVHGANRLDRRLPPAVRTLAEVLQEAGYRTGGFSANAHVTEASGFAQGFDHFEFLDELARGDALDDRALAWLDESVSAPDRSPTPFFLYVHAIDPHAPYEPPEDLRRRFAGSVPSGSGSLAKLEEIYRAIDRRRPEARTLVARMAPLYDAEIAGIDRSFGVLLDQMDRRGRLAETLVVVISDHGEEFGEHGGLGHGRTLYSEVLDVPWIVRLPGQTTGRRVTTPAAHLDVMPTILAALGIPAETGLRGVDRLAAETREGPRFSHLDYEGRQGGSVRLGNWHLIEPWSRKFSRAGKLFDLAADGQEVRDLAAENPVRAGYLRSLLRAEQLAERRRFAASAPLGAEEKKALEALGYL
jgi:arylsulfatase A-like enzyme